MALINCPECTKEISNESITCTHCGYRIKVVSKVTRKLIIGIILISIIGFFIVGYFRSKVYYEYLFNEYNEKYHDSVDKYKETSDKRYLNEAENWLNKMKEITKTD